MKNPGSDRYGADGHKLGGYGLDKNGSMGVDVECWVGADGEHCLEDEEYCVEDGWGWARFQPYGCCTVVVTIEWAAFSSFNDLKNLKTHRHKYQKKPDKT